MRIKIVLIFFLVIVNNLMAQEILTADDYLDKVSKLFGEITDYQADITLIQRENIMKGTLYYKKPHLLRIDFLQPEGQVISIDGEKMLIFLPQIAVTLEQKLPRKSSVALASMGRQQGLLYLINNYTVSYSVGPNRIPLDESHEDESVIKLQFLWRSTAEGFRELEISFDSNNLMRRIEGETVQNVTVQLDLENIILNQGIPEQIFEAKPSATSYIYKNFLFGEE